MGERSTGVDAAEDAVVVMVTVVEAPFAPGVTETGEKLQVALAGNPPQLKPTALENDPPTEEMVRA